MRRLAMVLMVGGMLACVLALASMLAAAPMYAQGLPERPTLTPIPGPQQSDDEKDSPSAPSGRITGTVIDSTTSAPVPGITVSVGGVSVMSDSNGNYDRSGLAAGDYPVALVLTAAQGVAEQGTITVTLPEGATVVQHLRFRSPMAATPPDPVALPATGGAERPEWLLMAGVLMMLLAALVRRFA